MHEAAVIRDLINRIETVARDEGAARVVRVHVRLGALSHMTPAHFREHFAESAAGTPAEGAALAIATCDDTTAPYAQGILLEAVDVE